MGPPDQRVYGSGGFFDVKRAGVSLPWCGHVMLGRQQRRDGEEYHLLMNGNMLI